MREKFKPVSKVSSGNKIDYYEFEIIAMNLKKDNENVNSLDQKAFSDYVDGEISLDECLRLFKKHNGIARLNIKPKVFKKWIESLGWVKE